VISFNHITKRYPSGREALSDLSLDIATGEMVFLTGHSGAGKSTALKLIGRIELPTRGQLIVNGQSVGGLRNSMIPAYRRRIGMVFQDHKLLHDRSIWDNVALPLIINGTARRELDKRVRAALDQVGLLGRETSFPVELSSGEQQRVGIARAVVSKPPILIADEPTGNLDPGLALEVMLLFKRFNDVGVTVVIASHDVHLIDQLGYRCISLTGGRLATPPLSQAHA